MAIRRISGSLMHLDVHMRIQEANRHGNKHNPGWVEMAVVADEINSARQDLEEEIDRLENLINGLGPSSAVHIMKEERGDKAEKTPKVTPEKMEKLTKLAMSNIFTDVYCMIEKMNKYQKSGWSAIPASIVVHELTSITSRIKSECERLYPK